MKTNVTDFRLDREVFIMKVPVRIIVSDNSNHLHGNIFFHYIKEGTLHLHLLSAASLYQVFLHWILD